MKTMTMPGFTGEMSLRESQRYYFPAAMREYIGREPQVISQLRAGGPLGNTMACCGDGRCCYLDCFWPCQFFMDCGHPDYLICDCWCPGRPGTLGLARQ
jgi:hypothetical protein